jgi:hypothetical protein
MTAILSGVYHRSDRDGIPPARCRIIHEQQEMHGEFPTCIYGFLGVWLGGAIGDRGSKRLEECGEPR